MRLASRLRPLVAALAILFSPGVLGPWVQLAHACPTETAMPGGHHSHHPGTGESGTRPACDCIGACQIVALKGPSHSALLTTTLVTPVTPGFRSITTRDPSARPHTLPFAHAPPSLSQ